MDGLRTDFGKDVFTVLPDWDDPYLSQRMQDLCDYWYGERGEEILESLERQEEGRS